MPVKKKDNCKCLTNEAKDKPFLYIYIYGVLVNKFGNRNMILPVNSIVEVFHRYFHNIPRRYDHVILRDLERMGYIEKIDKWKVRFNGYDSEDELKILTQNFIWNN